MLEMIEKHIKKTKQNTENQKKTENIYIKTEKK